MLVQSHKEEIEKYGYILLPAHISNTGEMVTYFPNEQKKSGPARRGMVYEHR
jgi:hypothetical protein